MVQGTLPSSLNEPRVKISATSSRGQWFNALASCMRVSEWLSLTQQPFSDSHMRGHQTNIYEKQHKNFHILTIYSFLYTLSTHFLIASNPRWYFFSNYVRQDLSPVFTSVKLYQCIQLYWHNCQVSSFFFKLSVNFYLKDIRVSS